jgi:acyl carrier protein phosphodiesterase
MNFIAHLVLSPKEKNFLAGNIAADFLRGFRQKRNSDPIRSGISMHQFVDQYTDNHPIVKNSKDRLKDQFHLLSGVLTDVFYDHFLARNFEYISNMPLNEFCGYVYKILDENFSKLPPRLQRFLPVMISENVLYSYREIKGVEEALTRINRRITLQISTELAVVALADHYELLENDFKTFFPCVIKETEDFRNKYDSFLLPEGAFPANSEVPYG